MEHKTRIDDLLSCLENDAPDITPQVMTLIQDTEEMDGSIVDKIADLYIQYPHLRNGIKRILRATGIRATKSPAGYLYVCVAKLATRHGIPGWNWEDRKNGSNHGSG
jgi:hypothetical protein